MPVVNIERRHLNQMKVTLGVCVLHMEQVRPACAKSISQRRLLIGSAAPCYYADGGDDWRQRVLCFPLSPPSIYLSLSFVKDPLSFFLSLRYLGLLFEK